MAHAARPRSSYGSLTTTAGLKIYNPAGCDATGVDDRAPCPKQAIVLGMMGEMRTYLYGNDANRALSCFLPADEGQEL